MTSRSAFSTRVRKTLLEFDPSHRVVTPMLEIRQEYGLEPTDTRQRRKPM